MFEFSSRLFFTNSGLASVTVLPPLQLCENDKGKRERVVGRCLYVQNDKIPNVRF